MKIRLFLIIILGLSYSAYSVEVNDPLFRELINNIKVTPKVEVGPCDDLPPFKFNGCKEDQIKRIESSREHVVSGLNSNLVHINEYLSKNNLTKEQRKFVTESKKHFECIQKKIQSDLTMKCDESEKCGTNRMYTEPFWHNKTVAVCPPAFEEFIFGFAGALVHEISHLCGSKDFEYIGDNSETVTKPKFKYDEKEGTKNADSYRYWYSSGFCIPDKDC